jgi:hypothetical protein
VRRQQAAFIVAVIAIVGLSAIGVLAAFLREAPLVGLPKTDFVGSVLKTGTSFDAATRELTVRAIPLSTTFGPGAMRAVTAPKSLDIRIRILDNDGASVASVDGHDLVMTGEIDHDGDGIADHSGVLLTAEVLAANAQAFAGPTDYFDFRFRVTGGSLMSLFSGRDLGVNLTVDGSTFPGHFSASFSGGAKGALGAISCDSTCN